MIDRSWVRTVGLSLSGPLLVISTCRTACRQSTPFDDGVDSQQYYRYEHICSNIDHKLCSCVVNELVGGCCYCYCCPAHLYV